MLRITTIVQSTHTVFELEGKLSGPWVAQLETCWRDHADQPIRVMLCGAEFIDDAGKTLLAKMYREGAELVAEGCLNKAVVEEIIGRPIS